MAYLDLINLKRPLKKQNPMLITWKSIILTIKWTTNPCERGEKNSWLTKETILTL